MTKKKTQQNSASSVSLPLRNKKSKTQTQARPTPKKNAKPKLTENKVVAWLKGIWTWLMEGRNKAHATSLGGAEDLPRFQMVWGFVVVCLVVLVSRAVYQQMINPNIKEHAEKLVQRERKESIRRGMITDASGQPLAVSAPLVTLIFSPYDYALAYYEAKKDLISYKNKANPDLEKLAEKEQAVKNFDLAPLAAATNYPYDKLVEAVKIDESIKVSDKEAVKKALPTQSGSRYMPLLKDVTPERAQIVKDLKIKGVFEEVSFKRYYLQAEPFATLVGFMGRSDKDDDYLGRAGIEQKYNTLLEGKPGKALVNIRAGGSTVKELKQIEEGVPAQDVQLTIDARLQYILYKELEQVGRTQSALSSSGIVVDTMTGDVLAMASWPSFNSNNLSERNNSNSKNRPLMDSFEPGSVMKPFTVVAALESGKYNTNSLINTSPGSLAVGAYKVSDSANYGSITLGKLIQKSSNVASARIALNLPADGIASIQRRFGFGTKTVIDFPSEVAGSVSTPTSLASRATLSYGYGQSVTLAQLAQGYAVFANQGKLKPLRLVKEEAIAEPVQVTSAANAQTVLKMMQRVTEEGGTATSAAIDGYHVAGKTGTVRRTKSGERGYRMDSYRTVFAGIAPVSNPRFVVAILVEDPRRQFYAGQVAAPVFHNVMKEALRLYNVPFDKALPATSATP